MQLLLDCRAEEVVIAFDKQYQELNTKESKQWSTKLTKLHNKYKNDIFINYPNSNISHKFYKSLIPR